MTEKARLAADWISVHPNMEQLILSFAECLKQARAGDPDARNELMEMAARHLRTSGCIKITAPLRQSYSVSDAAQDTLSAMNVAFDSFRGRTEAEWLGWARRIAANKVRDKWRELGGKNGVDLNGDPPGDDSTPSKKLLRKETNGELASLINRLPADQQTAIQLHYLNELTVAEIAQRVGKTEAAVAGLIKRGLASLRKWGLS